MFDYLAVLISVVLGLAIIHILTGISNAIDRRSSTAPDWLQLFWAVNVLAFVLAVWWGMYWWKHLDVWTVEAFAFLTAYAVALFMLASTLFGREGASENRENTALWRNRRWFFGFLLATHLIDIPETVAKQADGLRAVPPQYRIVAPAFIGIALTGLLTARRRVHTVLAPAWLAVLIGYEVFSSLDYIVVR